MHHLAQLNIGRLQAPRDSPPIAEFMAALVPVNALADGSPGFVWRLTDEDGADATSINPDADDPLLIVNLSTWESVRALRAFVYGTQHKAYLARRREWFQAFSGAFVVLWWVPAGHEPTVDEALARLAALEADGPSEAAFTFRTAYPAPATAA